MAGPLVWTFFYGSYINSDVLDEAGFVPRQTEVARLAGFEIRIAPLANLVQSGREVVYGILASGTHAELGRLYTYAKHVLGGVYLPPRRPRRTTGWQLPARSVLHRFRDGRGVAGSELRATNR